MKDRANIVNIQIVKGSDDYVYRKRSRWTRYCCYTGECGFFESRE